MQFNISLEKNFKTLRSKWKRLMRKKTSKYGLSVWFRKGSISCMTSLLKYFEIIATTLDKVTQWELCHSLIQGFSVKALQPLQGSLAKQGICLKIEDRHIDEVRGEVEH